MKSPVQCHYTFEGSPVYLIFSHWEQAKIPGLLQGARNFCPHQLQDCLLDFSETRGDTVSVTHLILSGPAVSYVLQFWSLTLFWPPKDTEKTENYKKQSSKLEKYLHLLAGKRRYLKANQFSEHISVSEQIYTWIYVGLTKSLKQRTAAAGGEDSLGSPFQWSCLSHAKRPH